MKTWIIVKDYTQKHMAETEIAEIRTPKVHVRCVMSDRSHQPHGLG